MRAKLLRTGLALLAALTLSVTPSLAQGRGRGSAKARSNTRTVVVVNDFHRHDRGRTVVVRDRHRVFYGDRFGSNRPPGWDRGRKVGWGNCDVPPGQAKKYGCRNGFYARDRYPRTRPVIVFPFF